MSRIAKAPIDLPSGVECNISGRDVRVKGKNGELHFRLPNNVELAVEDDTVKARPSGRVHDVALTGTIRAVVANMVTGVHEGFERKLELTGVGYRAQAQGNKLNLSLGLSHPVVYEMPEGVSVQTPSQSEIVLTGADKRQVGQVAADIRSYRPPEPYKGKGIRYSDEYVIRKDAKKK